MFVFRGSTDFTKESKSSPSGVEVFLIVEQCKEQCSNRHFAQLQIESIYGLGSAMTKPLSPNPSTPNTRYVMAGVIIVSGRLVRG